MMRIVILLVVLLALLTGCAADLMGQDWQAAHAEGEAARAAAEWARTHQVQAETAAAAREAPARARARTLTIIALSVVGVLTLAGLGSALVVWSWMRARRVYVDQSGLYPVVIGVAAATNLNEPGAQHARVAPHRTPIQVLPPAETDAIPAILEPVEIDGRRMQHIVRLTPLRPPPRLPTRVPLELDRRPAGDLCVPVGVGREGAVWYELKALGHTLITGTSGSGKSSWIHAGLAGLLPGTGRDRLQVALIDGR